MRHFTSSRSRSRSYSLVLSIVLCLANQPAGSIPEFAQNLGLNPGYNPAICDREYREKYFNDEQHRQAVQTGQLYEPPTIQHQHDQRFPIDSSKEDKDIDHSFSSNEDHDSSEIYHGNEVPHFINYENGGLPIFITNKDPPSVDRYSEKDDDLSEFMDEEDPHSELFYKMKKLARPTGRNFSELYKFDRKLKSKGRYVSNLWNRALRNAKRNMIARTRKIRSRAGGRFFQRNIGSQKSERSDLGRNSFSGDNRRFYTMMDTFGPMYNGRRGDEGVFYDAVRKAHWSQDNCKSLRRIVGGYGLESPEVLPYSVFVDTMCGGGIIDENWVLTAGHCADKSYEPTYVHVGSVKLMNGCQYNVERIYVHPHYSRITLENDLALLKISPSFVFSPAVKPISMSSVKAKRKSCGVVAGWGAEEYKGAPRIVLSMATIPIISRKRCRIYDITRTQFCAGYDDGHQDTCQGDSGGPFVVGGVLVGIVSYGHKCGRPYTPGIYVDVSYYRDWIRSISGI